MAERGCTLATYCGGEPKGEMLGSILDKRMCSLCLPVSTHTSLPVPPSVCAHASRRFAWMSWGLHTVEVAVD